MKLPVRTILAALLAAAAPAHAQYNLGSNGSYGPIDAPSGQVTTLTVPADGVFHATTITLNNTAVLRFICNASNTPIYLLAQGDITLGLGARIEAFGTNGTATAAGRGGCGGFDGGEPGVGGAPAGDGKGPGGGKAGSRTAGDAPGRAGYGLAGEPPKGGSAYGARSLVPMLGGSGGGGLSDLGGSAGSQLGGNGGGGAILLASNTRIVLGSNAEINANGVFQSSAGVGSGGAIRLVAPRIETGGNAFVCVHSGNFVCSSTTNSGAGQGRIRVDVIDKTALNLAFFQPTTAVSVGAYLVTFPTPVPALAITNVAGQAIAPGSGPVLVLLPNGSSPNQMVTVQGTDFTGMVPIRVAIIPDTGPSATFDAVIDMGTGNPASVQVPVVLPVNVRTNVQVWTQ
jgi:hypothetical protein